MNFHHKTREVAEFFGVSNRTVQNWHNAGCPRIRRGVFDLKAVHEWWFANIAEPSTKNDVGGQLYTARCEYWIAKAKRMELDAKKAEGQMLPKNEVITQWTARVIELTSGLEGLVDRLPPLLAGLSPKRMQPVIKREIRHLRETYARREEYCPTPAGLVKLLNDFFKKDDTDG